MKQYIVTKMISAEPMTEGEYYAYRKYRQIAKNPDNPGYHVVYSDGYESWSPTDVFERAYLPLILNKNLKSNKPSISQEMVDNFIKKAEVVTIGKATTVVRAELINGFVITESLSCVDPDNYDEAMGAEICMERIKNKTWELLGFLLATAVNGTKINE